MDVFSRHRRSMLLAGAVPLALWACGDARIKELSAGIPRDSALAILGSGSTSGDTLPNVQRSERYLVNGRFLEVLYYAPEARLGDSVPERRLTPVVLVADSVTGWGWTYFDSVAQVHNLPKRPRK